MAGLGVHRPAKPRPVEPEPLPIAMDGPDQPPTASQAPRPIIFDMIEYEDILVNEPDDDLFLPELDVSPDPPPTDPLPPIAPPPVDPIAPVTPIPVEPVVPVVDTPVEPVKVPEPTTDVPDERDEWEDEKALKPPSDDLPSFGFDGFESDEESALNRYSLRGDNMNAIKVDAAKEKTFYLNLVTAYEAFLSETGKVPTQVPLAGPSFVVESHHLKAIARVIKDPRLGKGIEKFSAQGWENLNCMGLKYVLNAIQHNPTIHTIRISHAHFDRDDDDRFVRFIQRSPHVTSIQLPSLMAKADWTGGNQVLRSLLREMASNKHVTELDLEAVVFSEVTFSMLLSVISTNTTLQKLNLAFSDFSYHNRAQRFMQAIIDNPNTALREIKFPLMRGAVLWTAQMLQYNRSLTHIDLRDIALGVNAGLLKGALEQNHQLQHLDVSRTQLTDNNLATLLEPLWTNSTLTHFDISGNYLLSNETARNLGDMLMQNTGIQTLILDSLSAIGKDKLAKRLAPALRVNSSLHHLSMLHSSTETAGITALAEALAVNHGIHELKLSHNPINDEAVTALVKGLKTNYGLHSLWLEHCKFGDSAIKAIVPWLKTTTVLTKEFHIGNNKVSEGSNAFLQEAIHSNPALKNLRLGPVSVEKSIMERLAALRSDVGALFQGSGSS